MSLRLIPARAGKTGVLAVCEPVGEAHPRSRGENPGREHREPVKGGSSPLARGKPVRLTMWRAFCGLIPARAGKTMKLSRVSCIAAAHPRSRGENPIEPLNEEAEAGSSPLARGKPYTGIPARGAGGLIPARAGKTPAHPRLHFRQAGSSPLARGKPHASCRTCPTRLAHPRSRGENLLLFDMTIISMGSSPLARGKPLAGSARIAGPRLIPARAGKTREPPPAL